MAEPLDGKVLPVDIASEMRQSYIDYAMSVIVNRALPDVRDGLKPVHRRILYAMREAGNTPDKPFKKAARTVGDVLGKYHPHSDDAVYDALVRMAQDFAMRYPLVEGHGNFGSIDGDPPAAMRYCVTGDTLVVTDAGLQRIDRLSPDGSEDVALRVLSAAGRINAASKWFDCGPFPVRRVVTRCGYEVTGTENHPLLCWAPDAEGRPRLVWKTVAAIQPGDWLVLDRSEDCWPRERVDLRDLHPVFAGVSRVERHVLPTALDEDLAFLLGALVAEGTVRDAVIEFTNVPGTFAQVLRETWERVFPTCRLHVFVREAVGYGRQPFYQMQVVSRHVIGFLNNLGLHGRSAERRVPEAVLRSPQPVAAAFLRALFEGDGAVERSGRSLLRVSLVSASRTLLRQVQTLLLRFGIVAALRGDGRGNHRLLLTGRHNLQAFAEKIGFVSDTKQAALRDLLGRYGTGTLSKTDYIPFLSEFVRARAGRGQREWLAKHNIDRPARLMAALPRLAEALPTRELAWIARLATGRYFFDQVVRVEDAGVQRVYSIRVDSPCHSFVANGFVNHNTEARLSPLAMELMRDLDKDTVDFVPNFDETESEPTVLPARFPNLLANGAAGIAVGMATNIPPHNLRELIDALVALIDDPDASVRDLMKHVRGPDFPTGGLIIGREGIREAYEKGRGTITIRADARIEEARGGKMQIVITEIPYQVSKAKIIEQIAELARERKVEGITDLRDETDRTGLRIVVELSRQANPNVVLNQLLKYTALQQNFGIIMLALVNGEPKILTLKEALRHYLDHQKEVVIRRTRFDLARAEERAHILEGLRIALDHIDEVIALIRGSRTVDEARQGLMERFGLSEKQAQAILDMRLQRLTGLEREKIEEEYQELLKEIEYLRAVLASEKMVYSVIRRELLEIRDKYGDQRRTRIVNAPDGADFAIEDLIADEDVVITVTHQGYIKRMPLDLYRSQRRGGRGVTGVQPREQDYAEQLLLTSTHHQLLFFTDRGRVYRRAVHEVPEASRQARGTAVVNLIEIERGEKVREVLSVREFEAGRYLVMATRRGVIKRTELTEYENIRRTGLIAITLDEGDDLVDVRLTDGRGEIMLVTRQGMSIRFPEDEVRPMGRTARGVMGVRLDDGDAVVGMEVVDEDAEVLVVTERGYGKRTPVREYRPQGRGGKGIKALNVTPKNGPVAGFRVVRPGDEVLLVSSGGVLIRVPVDDIPVHGRAAQGVLVMRLDPGDRVVALAHVSHDGEDG